MMAGLRAALGTRPRWSRSSNLHSGFLLRYEAGHPRPVSHIAAPTLTRCRYKPGGQLTTGEPELDLAGRGVRRIGAVAEVVLGDQGQVTADGPGSGLLDGIGAAGNLTEGGNGPRALDDHG